MAGQDNNKDAPKGWFHCVKRAWDKPPNWMANVFTVVVIVLFLIILFTVLAGILRLAAVTFGITGDFEKYARGVFVALTGLATAPLVIWRTWIAHKQASISEKGLITERFTRAVDQIGAVREDIGSNGTKKIVPNIEVRLGGLYALERIARDDLDYHWQVMEVLTAYIRENCGEPYQLSEKLCELDRNEWLSSVLPLLNDIQAALNIIGRRSEAGREFENTNDCRLNLEGTNLQKSNLWSANLESVYLQKSNLEGADLFQVKLNNAYMIESKLRWVDFTSADLSKVNFTGSVLTEAFLTDVKLDHAILIRVELSGVEFSGAVFNKTKFQRAIVWGADFSDSKGLTQNNINSMWEGDETTTLPVFAPDGVTELNRPKHWPPELSEEERAERRNLWREGMLPPGKAEEA